ncbi:MAG: 2-hydroxyhepta-2,4-diene,7-dioate isomerase [Hyphomicrobiales bacterium]|nr:2-hydroxyhepta-2,4-diene,7-dioate isomerase [Hyphomicrobiales bacterium]
MKICRFDGDRLGLVEDDHVRDVTAALDALPRLRCPAPMGDLLILHWDAVHARIGEIRDSAPRLPLSSIALLSPVANPSKIIGIARNRRDLAKEKIDIGGGAGARQDGDGIQMFIKAPSALVGPSEGVTLRFPERRTDPEAELTIVIGKAGSDLTEAQAMNHIFGYCIGLDMTLRGKESQSSRKSIDTYAVLGPWLVTRDEIEDPDALDTGLAINDRQVQRSNTRDLAFNIREIVTHASRFYTLHPGDAIMVGTPIGFEQVHPGDTMSATFAGIGRMDVAVR